MGKSWRGDNLQNKYKTTDLLSLVIHLKYQANWYNLQRQKWENQQNPENIRIICSYLAGNNKVDDLCTMFCDKFQNGEAHCNRSEGIRLLVIITRKVNNGESVEKAFF